MNVRKVIVSNELLLDDACKLLSEGKSVTLKVKGNSMLPFIVGGRDFVVLSKQMSYGVGDAVLAKTNVGIYVVHRIIKMSDDGFILMGDGNLVGTESCSDDDIYGLVEEVVRGEKTINCQTLFYRLKIKIWVRLFFLRRYLLGLYRRVYRKNIQKL